MTKDKQSIVNTKTCGTCAHWSNPENREYLITAVRPSYFSEELEASLESLAEKTNRKFGRCLFIYEGKYIIGEAEVPLPLALTVDYEDYKSNLMTRAEFGCVLHEEKTND